ncbi:hypothetical protein BC830DRAFT_397702 [Chytriomyces sp. MP71]|nr:hypothetical protein BC830DRAFT_397702 [Chytriomyces sp. MP71]
MGFLGWQRAPRVGGATVGYGEGTGFSWSANRERHGLRVVFVLRARSPALIEMFASKRTVSLANHPNTGNGESNASGGPSVKRSKKMDAGLSVAELREKHKLERKRRAAESAHSAPQPAMSAFVRDAPFTESAQRAPQAKPSDILSSNPSIKTSGILQVSQPQPLRQSNPFGQKPDARSHQTRNPFNILASIESTSYVCSSNPSSIFPTSTRLMTRYNSCPNVLQSSLQKPQSFSDHDSVEGDDDDDEDIFRESRQISDFIDQDEDLIAFHSACARLENGSLPDNCKTLAPLSRATSNTLSCEPYAGTATATSRLFSLLVNTKSDSLWS